MAEPIRVSIEHTPKRSFASAIDWPGWSRAGKTEEAALVALAAYAPRYALAADLAHRRFRSTATVEDLEVVERVEGNAGTDFGVPSRPSASDARAVDRDDAARLVSLVEAAWTLFDRVSAAAPEELRKGPRGGGRDTSKMVGHVREAEHAYAREVGLKLPPPTDDAAARAIRRAIAEVLGHASDGSPIADRRWPPRYAAHRIAWHVLDHAWEIEDRSQPAD